MRITPFEHGKELPATGEVWTGNLCTVEWFDAADDEWVYEYEEFDVVVNGQGELPETLDELKELFDPGLTAHGSGGIQWIRRY